MLKHFRKNIVQTLWGKYRDASPQIKLIETGLKQRNIHSLILDHFAIIDLPGPHTGIPQLSHIFSAIGYQEEGRDYLHDKQNDFLWMAESDSRDLAALDALPQVVVADFRLDELPFEIKKIIEKYSRLAPPFPLNNIKTLTQGLARGDTLAAKNLQEGIIQYLVGRDWPLPKVNEFYTVREFNELLAWVLVFGRRPNHFTLSIHLLNHFADLEAFHVFIEEEAKLELNRDGGIIKGGKKSGIAQGSTIGISETVSLSDGKIEIPSEFVEFVWRYPLDPSSQQALLWKDYFTGFIAQHANHVIESLYLVNET